MKTRIPQDPRSPVGPEREAVAPASSSRTQAGPAEVDDVRFIVRDMAGLRVMN